MVEPQHPFLAPKHTPGERAWRELICFSAQWSLAGRVAPRRRPWPSRPLPGSSVRSAQGRSAAVRSVPGALSSARVLSPHCSGPERRGVCRAEGTVHRAAHMSGLPPSSSFPHCRSQ